MKLTLLIVSLAAASALTTLRSRTVDEGDNPVTKVVNLLKEMKNTAEAEAKEDEEIYAKMGCWCQTNDKEKTEAIKIAEGRIESLTSTIEVGTSKMAELKTMIAGLEEEMASDKDALAQAVAIRAKENADFQGEDQDMSESSGLLGEAVAVLSKVQLVQKKENNAEALVQVKNLVTRAMKPRKYNGGAYYNTMQKDLWDMFGSLPGASTAPRVITGLSQEAGPSGAAAGSKSYNSRSGGILGLLEEMKSQIDRDLAAAHKAEAASAAGFQKLKASMEGQIQASFTSIEEKTSELADTTQKVAQAKEDLEDTQDALSSDEKFLMDLKERCKTADADFASRSKTRQDEIVAIGETIGILTDDEARDVISKAVSFVQTRSHRQRHTVESMEFSTRQHAASQLLQVARRHGGTSGGWNLALLAVSAQIDGFTKVKEMMDRMVAELKKQQGEEFKKHESCKKDIDANEDSTMAKEADHKDLDAQNTELKGQLESLTTDLANLATQVKEAHIAMKQAGETRKSENKEFQQVVSDQRATIEILNKALDRLKSFYANQSLLQTKQEPGAAAPPPPAAGKDFKANGMSGGVMQLLGKIIQDAEQADQEAVSGEQKSQQAYATFVANTNQMLDSYEKSIAGKTEAKDKATADQLTTKQDLESTQGSINDLKDVNKALHLECDYLVKNYNIRQTARQEEIEAIQEAKSILSGADLGF